MVNKSFSFCIHKVKEFFYVYISRAHSGPHVGVSRLMCSVTCTGEGQIFSCISCVLY